MALGVRCPRPRVNGVAKLLVRELLAGDVDRLEPAQLLLVRPLADIDHERVAEEAVALGVREVREKAHVVGEVARRVLAERDRALLAVHHLEGAVAALRPVHDVEREAVHDGVDHGLALPVPVDELALVGGADVEPAAVADDALVALVGVVLNEVADGDFMQFDVHVFHFPRRMTMRS